MVKIATAHYFQGMWRFFSLTTVKDRNLIDSHDVPRLHNNSQVNPKEYESIVELQFSLVGAPSIYYGDEAMIKGSIDTTEGCRATMPWNCNFRNTDRYRLYHCLTYLKQEHQAFTEGGMKFLYAQNQAHLDRYFTEGKSLEKY